MMSTALNPATIRQLLRLHAALLAQALAAGEACRLALDPLEGRAWLENLADAAAVYSLHAAGYTRDEIAEILDMPEETVNAHLEGLGYASRIVRRAYAALLRDAAPPPPPCRSPGEYSTCRKRLEHCITMLTSLQREAKMLEAELQQRHPPLTAGPHGEKGSSRIGSDERGG